MIYLCSWQFVVPWSDWLFLCHFFFVLLPLLAPEPSIPRVSSGLHHQQPGRAAQPGQQTQRDLHTRQQHRPGQTVPLLSVQEEHPEVNKGGSLYKCEPDVFTRKQWNSFNPGSLTWSGCGLTVLLKVFWLELTIKFQFSLGWGLWNIYGPIWILGIVKLT